MSATQHRPRRRDGTHARRRRHATTRPSADKAILSATDGFVVATASGVTAVRCGHGAPVGSAPAQESGCDALDVSVPSGAADKLLTVVARSGNGKVGLSLGGAALAVLDLQASNGPIDATTSATQGATLTIVSQTGDVVTLRLPRDFATDVARARCASVDSSAFPDVQAGKGRGETRARREGDHGAGGAHRPRRTGTIGECYFARAMASISTRAPFGSAETCTVARARAAPPRSASRRSG